jgi:DNA sulfur modification protein DndD
VLVFLKKNDHQFTADEIDTEINNIAPEKVSRFFLFDGELLQEYESLLDEKNNTGDQIKVAIEQVLGVPALINGRDECEALLKDATKKYTKELQNQKGLELLAKNQATLTAMQETHDEDLKKLKDNLRDVRSQLSALEDEMDELSKDLDDAKELELLKNNKKELEAEQAVIKENLLQEASKAWKELLRRRLLNLEVRMLETFQTKINDVIKYGELNKEFEIYQASANKNECEICESKNTDQQKIAAKIENIKENIAKLSMDTDSISKIGSQLLIIKNLLKSQAADNLRKYSDKITENEISIIKIDNQISDLLEKNSGKNVDEIKRKKTLHDNLVRSEGANIRDIQDVEKSIASIARQLEDLALQIKNNNTEKTQSKISKKVEIFSVLKKSFSDSIDILRDKLRVEVEKNATDAFKALISEKDFVQLKINKNYGLTIQDNRGALVDLRSAGQEEIVALALIDGLSRTGRTSGPVVMDTPFGRIDGSHRASILKYLPESAKQLILLVHDREIDRAKDLLPISHKIGGQYELNKKNSRYTNIERIS